jgi:hypothetical protein
MLTSSLTGTAGSCGSSTIAGEVRLLRSGGLTAAWPTMGSDVTNRENVTTRAKGLKKNFLILNPPTCFKVFARDKPKRDFLSCFSIASYRGSVNGNAPENSNNSPIIFI